jgi:hypothetical protein
MTGMALSALLGGCAGSGLVGSELGPDPLDAVYRIESRELRLHAGEASWRAAPGSATRVRTRAFGTPVRGDLDGDGDEDAALWLTQTPGGSGTFYYVAAALNEGRGYRGSVAVWVGDRIAPQALEIRNGVITANYADRGPGQAMALPPGEGRTAYLTWSQDRLAPVPPLAEGELLLQGWLVMGHEVRAFRPCGSWPESWLLGDSPALSAVDAAYRAALPAAAPYTPLFVTLVGRAADAPDTGFGASYDRGFSVSRLVQVWPRGGCGP